MRALWRWSMPILLLLLLGSTSRVGEAARRARSERKVEEMLYLPSPASLKLASFGYENVVADLLWFRAIQYYGGWRRGDHSLAFFHQLVRTVVELDPSFEEAYRFGALVLADDMGAPDSGIELLELGMDAIPESWWLPFEAGFIEYVVNMDDERAYHWFRRAAEVPGASEFPRRFAAYVAGRAGKLDVSLVLWKTIAQTTSNQHLREKALQYVAELEAALRGEGPIPDWAKRRRVVNGRAADRGF